MLGFPMKLARQIAKSLRKIIELLPFILPVTNQAPCELVIVTGANSPYYRSLFQFLASLYRHEPNIRVIVFDLGLSESERQHLQDRFPTAGLRLFDYSKFPGYFNIKVNAGEYAWKPVIFSDILNEYKSCVCWMDAGNVVTKPLFWMRRITRKIGMYSPRSSGCISDWTHPKTLEFLDVSKNLLNKYNLTGGCVSAYYQNSKSREIVSQWKKCAIVRDCIAPKGSSKKNHRQDQAVLSVLAHQSNITRNMPTSYYGFKIHQNIDRNS